MKCFILTVLLVASFGCLSNARAEDTFEGEYHARLSAFDHYSSGDQKLETVAAIIRQDRANYHKFKIRDEGDEPDDFFSTAESREKMEGMIRTTYLSKDDIKKILTGTPMVLVSIMTSESTGKRYFNVTVLDDYR